MGEHQIDAAAAVVFAAWFLRTIHSDGDRALPPTGRRLRLGWFESD